MATAVQSRKEFPIVRRGEYRLPPGLKLNLPFYIARKFFKPGDPIKLFEYLNETYGSMSHYRIANSDVFVVHEPEFIREILVNQADKFIKERTQKRMRILLGDGLITSDGEEHKRQRRIAAPAFHRQRIQAYGATMVEQAAKRREAWQPGREIDVAVEMMRVSLENVARTLFAQEVTADILSINEQVNTVMRWYNWLIVLPRAEEYLSWPVPGLMQFTKARKQLDAVVYRMIAEHRASGVDRGDLLSMLVRSRGEDQTDSAMTDQQLRDEVLTIFLAGY